MKKLISIIIFIAGLSTVNLMGAGIPVNIEAIENLGMGGPGTAIQGKYDVLYNPALLGLKSGFHLRLFDLPISVSNDIFKFYKFYKDNQKELENFTDTSKVSLARQSELLREITDTITKLKVRFRIGVLNPSVSAGPFPFVGRNGELTWGVGFYNQVDAGVKMNAIFLTIPTIDFWARADAVFAVPVAYHTTYMPLRLPGKIYAGINLKYIMRYKYEKGMSIIAFDNFDVDADDLKKGSGFGWDWGLLYDFSKKWNFSLVLKDFLSTRIGYDDDSSEVIKGQVDVGSSYKLNDMIILAADLRDIKFTDFGKATIFAKLHMGGELNLINIFKIRGGFYQGYPSFGFGLGSIVNYAFYGRELSMYPGLKPEWNHVVSLSFGF